VTFFLRLVLLDERFARSDPAAPELRVEALQRPGVDLLDWYLFIRVLQSFEVNFTYLANLLVDVIAALDSDDAESAAKHLLDGAETLDRALPLFSLLATMQRNSFTVFLSWPRGGDDEGRKSRITIELDFEGRGIGTLLVPLGVRKQASKEMPANLQTLKERLEDRK